MQSRDRQELESNRRPLLISAGETITSRFTNRSRISIWQKSDRVYGNCRGNFSRGIFATTYLDCKIGLDEIKRIYEEYYADHSFTFITDKNPDLKQVVNTNKCLIYLLKQEDKLLIVSMIDNLLKGASGQAVHNMNLLFGLEETVGLHLKPSAF